MEMNDVIDSFHHNHLLFNLKRFFLSQLILSNLGNKSYYLFFFFLSGKPQNHGVITYVRTLVPFLKKLRISWNSSYCQAFPIRAMCEWKQL